MEKEIRYYLAGKKTWNDVTMQVTAGGNDPVLPKKDSIVRIGKIKFRVKSVEDTGSKYKVWLEDKEAVLTPAEEALWMLGEELEVISIEPELNEARARIGVGGNPEGNKNLFFSPTASPDTQPFNWLTAAGPGTKTTLGGFVRQALSSLGSGYGVQVTDFGEVCTATVTYSNAQTGRCSSQSFAIIFRGKNSKWAYTVYSNSAKWRNCSGVDQAISFMRSKISSLSGTTSGAL
jgi:hypothetical protein